MDIIDIPAGTYVVSAVLVTTNQADHESFGFPQMYNPVTLRGASPDTTVIERVGSVSVSFFSVAPGGSVRIENMTLRNGGGNNIEHGGAVVSFGNLTINNVRFEHNDVYERGGAIYSANYATGSPEANLSIANSTFTDNHANIWGGAIYHGRAASPYGS